MKKRILSILIASLALVQVHATTITTLPDSVTASRAVIDANFANLNSGKLEWRGSITTAARNALSPVAAVGDVIYNTTTSQYEGYNGAAWQALGSLTGAQIKALYETEADTNAYTDAEAGKVGQLTVTQPVDLDALETAVGLNDAKVSNATHTGDVTGGTALTIATGAVDAAELASTAVTPGAYTNADLTIDADGRVTLAANGSGGGSGDFLASGTVPMTGNLKLGANWIGNDGGNEGISVDENGAVTIKQLTTAFSLTIDAASAASQIRFANNDWRFLSASTGEFELRRGTNRWTRWYESGFGPNVMEHGRSSANEYGSFRVIGDPTAGSSGMPAFLSSGSENAFAVVGGDEMRFGHLNATTFTERFRMETDGQMTFLHDVTVPAEVYGVGWNGVNEAATKDAVYDKIEAIPVVVIEDTAYGVAWDADLDAASKNAIYDKIEAISGTGEVNTASNLGGGLANFDSKSVADLRFNTFNAAHFDLATNVISLDFVNSEAAIEAVLDLADLQGAVTDGQIPAAIARDSELPVVSDLVYGVGWNTNTDAASKNAIYDKIESISGTGEVNTASNLGGGLAAFDSKSVADLRFNSFNAAHFDLATNVISLDFVNSEAAIEAVLDLADLQGAVTDGQIPAAIARDSELPVVSDLVYGVGWNANADAASKNAIYDKIETLGTGTDDQTASEVPNTAAGNIAATDVQAAINELDAEKISTRTGVYRYQYIDAGAMIPQTTNGATPDTNEYATNDVMSDRLQFDTATADYAQFKWAIPATWDGGTIKVKFHWTSAAADTDSAIWEIATASTGDNEAIDQAFGGGVTVTDNAQLAANELYTSASTAAVTVQGAPSAGHVVWFRVSCTTASTITEAVYLGGLTVQWLESSTETSVW